MPVSTILLVVLVFLLLAALPAWPYSAAWGYYPSGILGTALIVVLILVSPFDAFGGVMHRDHDLTFWACLSRASKGTP